MDSSSHSYNHTVSTLVDHRLITDSPISRMGATTTAPQAILLTVGENSILAQKVFPDHTRLTASVQYGPHAHQAVQYGPVLSGAAFGLTVPTMDGQHRFYLSVDPAQMGEPHYQSAVQQSLLNVAAQAQLQLDPAALLTVSSLLRLQPHTTRAWVM